MSVSELIPRARPALPPVQAADTAADCAAAQRERADQAAREVLRAQYDGEPALVVLSPPGAGKTDLIEKLATQAMGMLRARCLVVTQTNRQAFEFVARIRAHFPPLPVTLYCREGLALPEYLVRGPGLRVALDPAALPAGPGIVVANATKLAASAIPAGAFDFLVVDEAYQLPNYQFLSIAGLAASVVLVGDPGQIAPVVRAAITRWSADSAGPHVPAPQALLATYPDTRCVRLPVSRRLVDDSARIVQRAFYPDLPFTALERAQNRRIEFRRLTAAQPLDVVLRQAEAGATISMVELPPAVPTVADAAVAGVIARLLARVLERDAHLVTPDDTRRVDPGRLGVVCAHRAQVAAVRERLGPGLAGRVLVETANRYQGLERDLVIVWHPLTGRSSIHQFHVDAGRFCVMLSRHRAACVVVGRAGMDMLLDRYAPGEPPPLGVDADDEYDGWLAHRTVLDALCAEGRVVQLHR